jgi:hypothetical protein
MDTDLNNPAFESFLKFDEQILQMEEKLKQQANQFGFENEDFLKNNVPQWEKKFGQMNSSQMTTMKQNNENQDSDHEDMPPMPDTLPSHLKTKVVRHNAGQNDST